MSVALEALHNLAETEDSASDIPHRKVLSFAVNGETFAIAIDLIKEIIEFGSVTRVPMAPPHMRGVLNLRGSVVPVVDLAARMGKGRSAAGKRTCIVVIGVPGEEEGERVDLGVVVDAVNEVLDIPEADIEPAPAFGANVRPDFIDGMAKVRGKFVVVLDPTTTFAVEELMLLTGARDRES